MSQSFEYSHDASVKAITSFYEMMSRMHSDGAARLEYPPPTGWPQITQESFAGLGKTKEVIELLRHIPYFVTGPDGIPCILESTRPIEYIDRQYCEEIKRWPAVEEDDEEGRLPAYMIGLASGQRDGYTLLLDTKRGVVILWKKDGNLPKWTPSSDVDPYDLNANPYGPHAWKSMPTYRVETFFEFCKEQYRLMNWMPDMQDLTRGAVVQLNDPENASEGDQRRRQIMTDAGWPGIDGEGTGWDKEKAEREMDEHADEIAS